MPDRNAAIVNAIDTLADAFDSTPGAVGATIRLDRVDRRHWTANLTIQHEHATTPLTITVLPSGTTATPPQE